MTSTLKRSESTKHSHLTRNRWFLRCAAALCISVTAWWLLRPESFAHADAKLLEYTLSGNGAGVLSYMDPEEVKLTGATAPSMSKLLDSFVRVHLGGFHPVGRPEMEDYETATGFTHEFRSADGRRAYLSFQLQRNGREVVAAPIVGSLVLTPLWSEWPGNLPRPQGASKVAFQLSEIDKHLATLRETGLQGIVRGQPFDFSLLTWDSLHQDFVVRLAKVQAAEATIGPQAPRSYHSSVNLVP